MRRSIHTIYSALLVGGLLPQAFANDRDLDLRQDSQLGKPAASIGLFVDGEADLSDGSLSRQQFTLSAPLGIKKFGKHAFTIGVNYRLDHLDFSGLDLVDADYFHHIQVPLTWRWTPKTSRWGSIISLRPGLATDFNSVGSDSFSFATFGMASYKFTDTFTFGLGAYYSRDFGEDRIFPGIGLIWTPTPDWRLALLGPRITLSHQLTDNLILKAAAWTNGGSWHIEQNGENQDLNLSSFRAGLGLEYRLSNKIWLEAWAGSTFAQNVELADSTGNSTFDESLDSAAFGYVGLKITFW